MHATLKIAIAGVFLAAAMPAAVTAQSSTGNISGEAAAGDTITVTRADIGFERELKIDKDGKYHLRRVPTGIYHVKHVHKDGTIDSVQGVAVRPGGTARVMEPGKNPSSP